MKSEKRDTLQELEQGFGVSSRFRVTLHLVLNSNEAFTKYALVKATGLKTRVVEEQLETLVELGWAKEHSFTPTTYQINMENAIVTRFHEFLFGLKFTGKKR
jgi:hypothetical protein